MREELKRYKNAEKKQGMQCEPAGEEGRLEEDGKMEVDEEVDSKKLDQKKKELQKQLRDLEKLTCTPQDIQSRLKEECFKRLSTRGISCLSTKGCRRNVTSCRVSRANRNSAKRMLATAMETWSGSETRVQRGRSSSKNWNNSPRGFTRQKRSWMKKSETCKEETIDETAVRRSSPLL